MSRLQKNVLIWICRGYAQIEERGEQVEQIGIRFYVKPYREKRDTLSTRAALSRTMRSLEERGLVVRTRQKAKLYLKLTDFV